MTDTDLDVVVVGGGHAGLLAATGLARSGARVRVVEPQSRAAIIGAPADGRTLALLAGSIAVIRRSGALAEVEPLASPIWHTEVAEAGGGAGVGAAVHYDARREQGEPFGLGIENRLLRRALLTALEGSAEPAVLAQGSLARMVHEQGRVRLRLTDGTELTARLVVGADGRGSSVRRLAGLRLDRWSYPQSALAFIVAHERPHGHGVRERLRPGGPVALLPLPGERSGVTWVDRPDRAARLRAGGDGELAAALQEEMGGALGAMTVEGPIGLWPLGAQHARRYVAPRLALIGDAAHGSHPIHAQGFNMGVADVGALVELVSAALGGGRDPGGPEVLLAYERQRRPENARRLQMTDTLARISSSDIPVLAGLRRLGLEAMSRLPPLRDLVVRYGTQLS